MPAAARADDDRTLVVGRVRARLLGLPLLDVDVRVIVGPPTGATGQVVDLLPGGDRMDSRAGLGRSGRSDRSGRIAGRRSVRLARVGGRRGRRSRHRSRAGPGGAALRRSAELVRQATMALDEADELSARD